MSHTPAQSSSDLPTASSLLLASVKELDTEAWSRLVNTFGPIVYRWCRASGVRESDASDIVQDVFASVARGIADFEKRKDSGSFRSWLATITRNRVRDHYRRLAKRQQATGGTEALVQLQQLEESIDSTICAESTKSLIAKNVLAAVQAEFETSTWTAFWMTVVDGKSAADVAKDVGISVASVYQAKSRILRRLRQRLAELPD